MLNTFSNQRSFPVPSSEGKVDHNSSQISTAQVREDNESRAANIFTSRLEKKIVNATKTPSTVRSFSFSFIYLPNVFFSFSILIKSTKLGLRTYLKLAARLGFEPRNVPTPSRDALPDLGSEPRPRRATWLIFYTWLGWKDSNLRMEDSESSALPLGYTPSNCKKSCI